MGFLTEVAKFIVYCSAVILLSKYILATTIRKIAQTLKLTSKNVGEVAGYATSVPELLTVAVSNINGLTGAGIYNILSSNIINFLQYIGAIIISKNQKLLKKPLIKVDIILVIATILIPIFFIQLKLDLNIITVLIFVILYVLFRYIDVNAHKLYSASKVEHINNEKSLKEWGKSIKYIIILILSTILLFVVGDLLGKTLENLCYRFNVPEIIIGILLGIITSIPELITFFEAQKHHKKSNNEVEGVIEATKNLFTSNVLNLFIIQSIGVLLYLIFA